MVLIHMYGFRVGAALICTIFLFSVVLLPFVNADWIMFRSDPSHSGVGTGNPVLTPTLLWKYAIRNMVYSSPAVVGGVVYVGSFDGNVYALGGSPTPSPSPTPIPTPTASSSPAVPEFPDPLLITTLVVSMIILLSAVIIAKKRITSKTQRG